MARGTPQPPAEIPSSRRVGGLRSLPIACGQCPASTAFRRLIPMTPHPIPGDHASPASVESSPTPFLLPLPPLPHSTPPQGVASGPRRGSCLIPARPCGGHTFLTEGFLQQDRRFALISSTTRPYVTQPQHLYQRLQLFLCSISWMLPHLHQSLLWQQQVSSN